MGGKYKSKSRTTRKSRSRKNRNKKVGPSIYKPKKSKGWPIYVI